MVTLSLKERVSALEAEVARLKARVEAKETPQPWWQKITGVFANDPAFEEAMRLGRAYRESLRPKPRRRKKRGNGGT